jgi:phage shock protein C
MDARLVRSTSDRMLGGVCGGLARYFGIDATIVRLVFVLAVLSGLSPLIYVILWVVMPQEGAPAPSVTQPGAALPAPTQPAADPTGEWKFDPYTGEPVKK